MSCLIFIKQLEHKTSWLNNGEHVLLFEFSSRSLFLCNEELDPHWKKFATALQADNEQRRRLRLQDQYSREESQRQEAECWSFQNIHLPIHILRMLDPALVHRNICSLKLEQNHFDSMGYHFLADFLYSNTSLETLEINNNPIVGDNDVEVARRFCGAVADHPSLKRMCFVKTDLGRHSDILGMILNASMNLNFLDLSRNHIDDSTAGGGSIVVEFLAGNPPLKRLSLEHNRLGNNFAIAFAQEALTQNNDTNLQSMDLRGNNSIDDIGKNAVRQAQFNTTSLHATVGESNHTCNVIFDSSPAKDRFRSINTSNSIQINKKAKILSYLRATKRLDIVMENVPLEIMPEALALMQNDDTRNMHDGTMRYAYDALQRRNQRGETEQEYEALYRLFLASRSKFTMTFEVLRMWNLPLIFTNL